jgi:hypothetical protein
MASLLEHLSRRAHQPAHALDLQAHLRNLLFVLSPESRQREPRHAVAPEPAQPSYYGEREREPSPPLRVTRVLCDGEWLEFCLEERVRASRCVAP